MLSDVIFALRFLADVFSFVVHTEFQVGVLAPEEFWWNILLGKELEPLVVLLLCCCVSFVWDIARDSSIVNTVSQTMNKHISFS